jgi:hypothetical protein
VIKHIVVSGTTDVVLNAAEAGKVVRLLALAVSTEADAADVRVVDSDGTLIGGKFGLGKDASHVNTRLVLPYNPVGWAVSASGKGMTLDNEDGAAVTGIAVIEVAKR